MASSSSQLFSFVLLCLLALANSVCRIDSCGRDAPDVRFPFRLTGRPARCGYRGFSLSCKGKDTIIQLTNSSGKYIVEKIDYNVQTISINDPDHCLPRRFLYSFNLSGSPFQPIEAGSVEFKFFNCSSGETPNVNGSRRVACLSGENFVVFAVPVNHDRVSVPSCSEVSNDSVPILWPSWSGLEDGVVLKWEKPNCSSCAKRGGFCSSKSFGSSVDTEIGCDAPGPPGLPRTAKYGIIIGVAIPGLLCGIGLVCYVLSKIRAYYERPSYDFTASITPQPALPLTGLDGSTIESFTKIQLGESGRLPKPNDNTCPICLSEYQPKETLRTIPECDHYFHADCIDEWLKMNATCPLCRNSPDGSDIITPSSSSTPSSWSSPQFSP